MKSIRIGQDFSVTPWGRYRSDSSFSGEVFREDVLLPALQSNPAVEITIDDVEGYGSSFLEESFGGLVRKGHFSAEELSQKLTIKLSDLDFEIYRDLIWRYIKEAKKDERSVD